MKSNNLLGQNRAKSLNHSVCNISNSSLMLFQRYKAMRNKSKKFHKQYKLMKASLEQLSITEGIFESTLTSSMVLCPASLRKWILCSLCFTEKAKWSIYKTSKEGSEEERGEQNALDSWFRGEWDKYKHSLYQCHLVESLTLPLAAGNVCLSSLCFFLSAHHCCCCCCLSLISLSLSVICPLSCFISHTFSLVLISASQPALSTKVMHTGWSDSPLRHILAGV